MRKIHKFFLWTNNFIEKTITIIIIAVATAATDRNHIVLYIIRKNIAHKNILRRNKKSLKPSLKLLIEINLANLITDLRDDLINIL